MKKERGFTLIELLAVILIIALLSAIGMAVYAGAQKRARDARRRADIQAIADAFEQYNINTGEYPVSVSTPTQYYVNAQVPKDPKSTVGGACPATAPFYCYACNQNGSSCTTSGFTLCAVLEQDGSTFCKGNRQ